MDEKMVTDVAFAKTASAGFGTTEITTAQRFGRGQSAYANGEGSNNILWDESFQLFLYFKISNTASWVQSASAGWGYRSDSWKTIYCQAIHNHYVRWYARWYANTGDGKANVQGNLYVRSAQANGVGTGKYLRNCSNFGCGTSDVAPTWNRTAKMTTAHNILATVNKTDY